MAEPDKRNTETYRRLRRFYACWNFGAGFYQTLYIVLAIISVAASLVVAAFAGDLKETATRVIAFVGALSLGILNSINFAEKAANFRRASDHLNVGLIRWTSGSASDDDLITGFKEAQAMIGAWKFSPPTKPA